MLGQYAFSFTSISGNIAPVTYYLAGVSEVTKTNDSTSQSMRAPASIAEAATLIDNQSDVLLAFCSVLESGNLVGSALGQMTSLCVITESIPAPTEIYFPIPIFNVSEKVWHLGPRPSYWITPCC